MISNYHHFSIWNNVEFARNLYTFTNSYLFKNDQKRKKIIINIGWFYYVYIKKLDNNRVIKIGWTNYLIPIKNGCMMHIDPKLYISVPLGL